LPAGAAALSGAIGDETGAPRNSVTGAEAQAQRALAALRGGDVRAARRALLDALRALEDDGEHA
jgi:hypothetical protein